LIGVQNFDRSLHQRAAIFGADDNSRLDRARFDQRCDLHGTVEQPKAGVGNVIHPTIFAQTQPMVNLRRRRGLKEITTNAGVNQATDLRPIDSRVVNCGISAGNARPTRRRSDRPKTPAGDPAHQLQTPRRQPQSTIERLEL
jgi:hypothetical protein